MELPTTIPIGPHTHTHTRMHENEHCLDEERDKREGGRGEKETSDIRGVRYRERVELSKGALRVIPNEG